MKRLDVDTEYLVHRHRAGATAQDLARELGVSHNVILRRAADCGLRFRGNRRDDINVERLVELYADGIGTKILAEMFDTDPLLLNHRLRAAGVRIRTRSEAMLARMARTPPEERMRLTEAAHAAVRGRPAPESAREQMAATAERTGGWRRSPSEDALRAMLHARGLETIPQKAIGRYFCDLAADPVIVEVFGGHWHFSGDHAARMPRRTRSILDAGWHLLIVWITATRPLTTAEH